MDQMPKSAKRGVSFNFLYITDLPLLSPYISWDYNWGNTPNEDAATWFDANEMDFCPMCWNGKYDADKIRAFVAAHPNTKYLLAFNEPNLTDQANMVPSKAAELWPPVVALAKELNLKLVSPAMNYGTLAGYSDPVKWLDEFFAQPGVSIDDVYAIAIHCYMASASAVKSYVERFEKYDKPIWMTAYSQEGVRRSRTDRRRAGPPENAPKPRREPGGGPSHVADGHFLFNQKYLTRGGSTAKPHGPTESGAPGKRPEAPA